MRHGYKVNLDLLRATAILVVVAFHISQYTAIPDWGRQFFALGTFGVDLFFVLSGWLIGGIFFREYQQRGHVDVARFWGRRWLRTMPPYYVALLISWLAVYVARHQAFDPRYLVFLQNYSSLPPFFLVSWSLCIEEHFYLLLPLVLYVGLRIDAVAGICLAIIAVSVLARLTSGVPDFPSFGYHLTATHFRLDGLALGVLCAYVYTLKPATWPSVSRFLKLAGGAGGVIGLALYFLDGRLMYSFGILGVSVGCAGLLCLAVDSVNWRLAASRVVSLVAGTSYSLYLTHALAIHLTRQYIASTGLPFIFCSVGVSFAAGYVFYAGVEGVAKKWRDYVVPAPAICTPARTVGTSFVRRKSRVLAGLVKSPYRGTYGSEASPEPLEYTPEKADINNVSE